MRQRGRRQIGFRCLTDVMKAKGSLIHIKRCQVKSLEKAQILCRCLDVLEKEFGIHSVRIRFTDNFICPDIDLTQLSNSDDPMEKLIGGLMIRLDKQRFGKHSKYRKTTKWP